MKDAAIFIVNFNGYSILGKKLLNSIDSFIRETESLKTVDVWFVDNGSTDESLSHVKKRYGGRLDYIGLRHNLGYGGACLVAYKHINSLGLKYRYYICSNNDIELYPNRLYRLMRWLNTIERMYPRGFIATPLLINAYDGYIDFGGYFIDEAGNTWPLRLIFLNTDRLEKTLRRPIPVGYADGAFHITHYKVIEDIGWFNPHFFLYYEDTEFSLRAWIKGYPSILIPLVVGKHYRGVTSQNTMKIVSFYTYIRNKVYTVSKYLGLMSIVKLLIWYLFSLLRIIEFMERNVRNSEIPLILPIISDITPSIFSPNYVKIAIRALLDGYFGAYRSRKNTSNRKIMNTTPLLQISSIEMISYKKVISSLQNKIKDLITLMAATIKCGQ